MRMAAISGRITGGVPLDVRIGLFLMPSINSSTAPLSDIAVREERIARFSAYAPPAAHYRSAPPPLIPRRYAQPSLRSSPPSRRRSSCSGLKYPVNCAVGSSLGLAGADGRAVGGSGNSSSELSCRQSRATPSERRFLFLFFLSIQLSPAPLIKYIRAASLRTA